MQEVWIPKMNKIVLAVLGVIVIMVFGVMLGLSGCSSEVQGKTYTSTVTNGHTHTVVIPNSDFTNPPKEKVYTTSKGNDGHTHQIVLREVNFSNINRGIAETRLTSNAKDGHSHEITIK
jgi:hypothetical protein